MDENAVKTIIEQVGLLGILVVLLIQLLRDRKSKSSPESPKCPLTGDMSPRWLEKRIEEMHDLAKDNQRKINDLAEDVDEVLREIKGPRALPPPT